VRHSRSSNLMLPSKHPAVPLTPEEQKEFLRTHSPDPVGLCDITNMDFNRHELEIIEQAFRAALCSGHALTSRDELRLLHRRIANILDRTKDPSSSQKSNVCNPARS
jgi:hypothetical protein